MACEVVFLQQAELDLKELKNYIIKNFSHHTWKLSYQKIKNTVNLLKKFPKSGSAPPELEELGMSQYRQIITGKNRIIYEIRSSIIYIHIICDVRRDMQRVLATRLVSRNTA